MGSLARQLRFVFLGTVLVVAAVVPWDHVYRTYVAAPAERWRSPR